MFSQCTDVVLSHVELAWLRVPRMEMVCGSHHA